jgi:glycosyltransferase involved in cell wall biosynthesis
MIHIAVLLNNSIFHDTRVIKTILALCKIDNVKIDLFYIEPTKKDTELFDKNKVRLFPTHLKKTLKAKLIKHSIFYKEFLQFVPEVLKTNTKYKYIISNDLPCLFPGVILKKKLNSILVYDSHEIYIETINQFFPSQTNPVRKLIFKMIIQLMRKVGVRAERKLVKKVDHFITVGNGLKNYFEKKYKLDDICIIRNTPKLANNITPIDLHKLLNIKSNSFVVLYQGNLNIGRGLHHLIQAMKNTHDNIVLLILGDGFIKNDLINLTEKLNLQSKVFFHSKVPSDTLLNYTAAANCGINLLEPVNLSKSLAAPNKLFEYIHAKIPVISSYSYENNIILEEFQIGLQTNIDSKEIAQTINKISEEDHKTYIENCIKAQKKYNWQEQEKKLIKIFT